MIVESVMAAKTIMPVAKAVVVMSVMVEAMMPAHAKTSSVANAMSKMTMASDAMTVMTYAMMPTSNTMASTSSNSMASTSSNAMTSAPSYTSSTSTPASSSHISIKSDNKL